MLVVGLLASIPIWPILEAFTIFLIFFYALFANFFFTFGVIPEIALTLITRQDDHPLLRKVCFILGLLFSILVTIMIAWEVTHFTQLKNP